MRLDLVRLGVAALAALGVAVLTLPASVVAPRPLTPVVRADDTQSTAPADLDTEFRRQIEAGRQRELDRRRETELALERQGAVQVDPATGVVSSVAGVCRQAGAPAVPFVFFFTWEDPDTGAPVSHARIVLPAGECP
jgi:hypothetical protein